MNFIKIEVDCIKIEMNFIKTEVDCIKINNILT